MLKAKRRTRRLSMTSLIDVIFLLLLFFMLTSTFTKFAEVKLTSASAGGAAQSQEDQTPPLFVKLEQDSLSLNAAPVTMTALAKAIMDAKGDADAQRVMISMAAEADAQRLIDVLVVLRSVPGLTTTVIGAGL